MSWGSGAASGSSAVGEVSGSAAGNAGSAADLTAAGGEASAGAQPISGFSMNTGAEGVEASAGNTPTDGTYVSMTPNQTADKEYYGTANPSFMDKASNMLERFQKGGEQGLFKTKLGNNPETYGAVYGVVNKMAGTGKPQSGAPITTNISYQQPENPYLRKRGRY